MSIELDHQRAKELGRHRLKVAEIKRRAHRWRLTDCDESTLAQMRHALIEEMEQLEQQLERENSHFMLYVENGQPLQTEKSLQTIDKMAREWEQLNDHLQDVDEALLERHLRTRLIRTLGGARRLVWLDSLVFGSIILIVILTIFELLIPLPPQLTTLITIADTIICVFLISDFLLRVAVCEDRGWYVRRYWIDFVAAIPFQLLSVGPLVSVARFARLLRLLRLGRAFRLLSANFRSLSKLFETLQLNLLKRALLLAIVLLVIGAFSISAAEPVDAVSGLGESLWWSFATVVTGGFADLYNPVTVYGRLLTVGLVLLGLTVTGIFTASLTSVLVEDESSRIEQAQLGLEERLGVIDEKLDQLSSRTNEGLIALETVAQQLSNQPDASGVAEVLTRTMLADYRCLQASVHLLTPDGLMLQRVLTRGETAVSPPDMLPVGEGFLGHIAATLLAHPNVADTDLEPETAPRPRVKGVAMVCPMVAGGRVHGLLHIVLPEDLGRFYLYNRAPMTLAHQAANAFYAVHLANGRGPA